MVNKIMRLNESQLKNIVKESVKRVLMEMSEEGDEITMLAQQLQNVMHECGEYYSHNNEIPISELGLTGYSKTFGGKLYFDTLQISEKSEPAIYDYEHYTTSLYGPNGRLSQDDNFEYSEFGPRQGAGWRVSALSSDYYSAIVNFLKAKINEYTTKMPEYKKKMEDNKRRYQEEKKQAEIERKWLNSLPFIEKYFLRQYGREKYEDAFKKKVPDFYRGFYK